MKQAERTNKPTTIKDTVRSQFDPVAANYATSDVHAQGDELAEMLTLARLSGGERVLDAGCGPGHTALCFAPHVESVIGVDLSAAMLREGRRLATGRSLHNIEFREGDVEALPFADDSFDIVVSRYSAHHWPNPRQALSEFRRVLDDGTIRPQLLLVDLVSFDSSSSDTHLQAIELLRDPSHVRDHRRDEWLAMLESAGFDARTAMEWRLALEFEPWVKRIGTPAASVAMIRAILADSPQEVREELRVEADGSVSLPVALFHAIPQRKYATAQ